MVNLDKVYLSFVCQHFQSTSPLKLLSQFHLNFTGSLLRMGDVGFGETVYTFGL